MRIVIAGGGVAGLTLASLLDRHGHRVTVVDPGHGDDGYALALWPHGTRVLHAVGVHDGLLARSLPMARYTARSDSGRLLASTGPPPGVARHGHLGIVPRSDLVELLGVACGDVDHRRARVVGITQDDSGVEARLDDGSPVAGDLLVAADGIGSAVRTAVLGDQPRHDTGWTCATWWIDREDHPGAEGETVEHWGAGSFIGSYPCRGRTCLVVGGPARVLHGPGADAWLRGVLTTAGLPGALVPTHGDRWLWPMADVRSARWARHRVALVGDAAAAFLPTAGVGASTALESAAALADELTRCDARHVPTALRLYERRRKARVERAQRQSRLLARVLFTTSPRVARLRDTVLRLTPAERLLDPLVRDLDRPA